MLGNADLVAFVGTTNADRSRAFYEGVLGLKFVSDDGFGIMFDANGVSVRMARMNEVRPAAGTTLGWHVEDVSATVAALAARGVIFERFPGMDQDELGVWHVPGGGKVAWFKDPDGQLLSVSG